VFVIEQLFSEMKTSGQSKLKGLLIVFILYFLADLSNQVNSLTSLESIQPCYNL